MKKDKKHQKEQTSNEAADLFSHPSKFNKAFTTEHEEHEEDSSLPKEGEALIDHYSDKDEDEK
ncbi:hypothetical protein [Halobacillus massiliensis]|uniref:hypothetical protein n=1 Tax=Halobacillus massiliensis TaxID=1926286 RepID=UPI0009E2B6DD|nr:hypothetical protein [Halobacillus massiliensis]